MASALKWCWGLTRNFKYNTVQIVAIKSPTLSLIFRVCQFAIILYIIVSVIVLKKGYQKFEAVSGTTVVKTKGSTYNAGGVPWLNKTRVDDDYSMIYDSTDLVYPSTERDATFITTNIYITGNQTRTTCYPGSDAWYTEQVPVDGADAACGVVCVRGTIMNEADNATGGVWSGQYTLKPSTESPTTLLNCYCELYTWCPDENIPDNIPTPDAVNLKGIGTWTVSFRQNVQFKGFDVVTTNMVPKTGFIPPLYSIEEMLVAAGIGQKGTAYDLVRKKGAVIVMASDWNCNLDYSVDLCNPKTSFVNLGQSYNFRRAEYASTEGFEGSRQLLKHYGVRIMILLSGTAGKFDPAAFFTNIGAGIGLLAVATLVADFVAVNLLGHRALYEKAKFKQVEIDEEGRPRGLSQSTSRKDAGHQHADVEGGLGHRGYGSNAAALPLDSMVTPADVPTTVVDEEHEEAWGKRQA